MVLAGLTFVIWAMESVFQYAYAVYWRNLAQSLQHDLRVDAYDHVQGLDLAYFEDRSTGGLMAILNNDINQLERFLDGGVARNRSKAAHRRSAWRASRQTTEATP